MSDLFTAAENVRRFAKQFEGILAVADVLESLGKLDQIKAESEKGAAVARAEADKAKADLVKVKAQVKEQAEKGDALIKEAAAAAQKQAEDIQREAQMQAAETLKKAQDEAAAMIAKASTEKARLSSEIGGLQSAIESGRSELVSLKAAKDVAEAATADAEKKLDGIKGKLKALLG